MPTEINSEKYKELQTRVMEEVTDLNAYDSDDYTSPKEVDALWENSEHFVDWLNTLLTRSGEIALNLLEDEKLFVVKETKPKPPTIEFEALVKSQGYVGQNGWVEETALEIDQGNTLLEEKLEPIRGKRVRIIIEELDD